MKKILILWFIILAILNQSFAENIIPEKLNECLKIETEWNDNFIFSPDWKNFAYTIWKSIYKNWQKIDELESFMEIKWITFKNDNETILVFANGIFSKVQYQKYQTNYNTNWFIIDYPTNTNWINKRYWEIVSVRHSKDWKSWAILNDYYSIWEDKHYFFIIKDDKEIWPFDSYIDFWYDENWIFSYEYVNKWNHCINSNWVDICDKASIISFKDSSDKERKKSYTEVYYWKDYVSKYFKIQNTEIWPFNIIYSSDIITSNDASKTALTTIPNNLIICDRDLKIPKNLNYINDLKKVQNSKDLYKISDLENIQFLTKIPYDFNWDILQFIKDVKEKIIDEEIIKIYQKEKDTLIITKKINNERDWYEIKIYKNFEETTYWFDEKYFTSKYNDKVKILSEYHDIFVSLNLENIIITPSENWKRKILLNWNFIYESDLNTFWNYIDLSFSKKSQDFAFLSKKNNRTYFVKYINKKIIETEIKENISDIKITQNLDIYYVIWNILFKNHEEWLKSSSNISYYRVDEKWNIVYTNEKNDVYFNKNILFSEKNWNKYFATLDEDMNNIINIFYNKDEKYQITNNWKLIDNNKYDYIDYNAFYNNWYIYYVIKNNNNMYLYSNWKKILDDSFEWIDLFSSNKPIITHKDGYYTIYIINNWKLNKITLNEIQKSKESYTGFYTYWDNIIFTKEMEWYIENTKLVELNINNMNWTKSSNTENDIYITNKNEKTLYSKQLLLSKLTLTKLKKENYIKNIDIIIQKLSKEKWKIVLEKIKKLQKRNKVIDYLEAKIYLQINN